MQIKKLGEIAEYINGRAFKPEEWEKHGKPIIRIQNLTNSSNECNRTTKQFEEKYAIKSGDLLFAWSASLGAHIWNAEEGWLNQHIFKVIPKVGIDKMYLYYFLLQVVDELYSKTHGTGMVHITLKPFKNTEIPVPSYEEQRKIVVVIESLFSKLDEAKEKVKAVLDASENRKAAILHKAFSGELTETWRRISKLPISNWNENTLDSVCKSIFDGDHMPPPKADDGIPFLVISNINTGYLSFANTRFVQKEYYNGLKDTRKPEKGDILYTIVGSIGIPVMVNTDKEFCFQRHIALLKPKSINPKYLWYLLQTSEMYSRVLDIATGTAQLTVPIKGLRELTIRYPSIEEQNEIVISLDGLLTKENKMVEIANQLMFKIDLIKKSILAKAFRGELGTNDITDENSIELLKEILI